MNEPRTEAGRALVTDAEDGLVSRVYRSRDAVLAIEDEAAREVLERLRRAVEGLTGTVVLDGRGIGTVHEPTRAAILAIIGKVMG